MAYGDNPKIVKDRTTTVTVEIDSCRPGVLGARAGRDNSSHKAVWVWFDE